MTLEVLLNSRRTMDFAVTSGAKEIMEIAIIDYQEKLKTYVNENSAHHPEQLQLFAISEQDRIERLAQFNNPGSNDVDQRNNAKIRTGSPDIRSTHPVL